MQIYERRGTKYQKPLYTRTLHFSYRVYDVNYMTQRIQSIKQVMVADVKRPQSIMSPFYSSKPNMPALVCHYMKPGVTSSKAIACLYSVISLVVFIRAQLVANVMVNITCKSPRVLARTILYSISYIFNFQLYGQ